LEGGQQERRAQPNRITAVISEGQLMFLDCAGIGKTVTPHTLRHAFITAALDAGVPLRDVQEAASHADPRTTMRYDRARGSLDRHATYIVAAYIAGAAR
jgi:integrase/recombinase XerD